MDLDIAVGSTIDDRYEVLAVAGKGGGGTIFRARQNDLDRIVAIKVLDSFFSNDAESLQRFRREARALSRLSHKHISSFYSCGTLQNTVPYIVMEYLEGVSLCKVLGCKGKLDWLRAIKIALEVAGALGYAHSAGIIHRDLKPANILLLEKPEADFVKLIDFGLASWQSETSAQKLTTTFELIGTPGYMSPEQCVGQPVNQCTDIYAIGIVIYEMITGRPPFIADTPMRLIYLQINNRPVIPSKHVDTVLPPGLDLVILKCLEKSPKNRYQNMEALASDLIEIAAGRGAFLDICLQTVDTEKPAKQPAKASKLLLFACLILLFLASVTFYFTRAGLSSLASISLRLDGRRENAMHWLEIADSLLDGNSSSDKEDQVIASDKSGAGTNLIDCVERSLKMQRLAPLKQAEQDLSLATLMLRQKKYKITSYYAFKAMNTLCFLVRHGLLSQDPGSEKELCKLYDEAAAILLVSKCSFQTPQLRLIVLASEKLGPQLAAQKSEHVYQLLTCVYKSKDLPVSEALIQCLYIYDKILLERQKYAQLDAALATALSATSQQYGADSSRAITGHYLQLASTASTQPDKTAAKQLIEKAYNLTIGDVNAQSGLYKLNSAEFPRSSQQEAKYMNLSSRLCEIADVYCSLGLYSKALSCAKNAEATSTAGTLERVAAELTRAQVLGGLNDLPEAEEVAFDSLHHLRTIKSWTSQAAGSSYGTVLRCMNSLVTILISRHNLRAAEKVILVELAELRPDLDLPELWLSYYALTQQLLNAFNEEKKYSAAMKVLLDLRDLCEKHDKTRILAYKTRAAILGLAFAENRIDLANQAAEDLLSFKDNYADISAKATKADLTYVASRLVPLYRQKGGHLASLIEHETIARMGKDESNFLFTKLWINVSSIYERESNLDRALYFAQKAVELSTSNTSQIAAEAKQRLAEAMLVSGNLNQAEILARESFQFLCRLKVQSEHLQDRDEILLDRFQSLSLLYSITKKRNESTAEIERLLVNEAAFQSKILADWHNVYSFFCMLRELAESRKDFAGAMTYSERAWLLAQQNDDRQAALAAELFESYYASLLRNSELAAVCIGRIAAGKLTVNGDKLKSNWQMYKVILPFLRDYCDKQSYGFMLQQLKSGFSDGVSAKAPDLYFLIDVLHLLRQLHEIGLCQSGEKEAMSKLSVVDQKNLHAIICLQKSHEFFELEDNEQAVRLAREADKGFNSLNRALAVNAKIWLGITLLQNEKYLSEAETVADVAGKLLHKSTDPLNEEPQYIDLICRIRMARHRLNECVPIIDRALRLARKKKRPAWKTLAALLYTKRSFLLAERRFAEARESVIELRSIAESESESEESAKEDNCMYAQLLVLDSTIKYTKDPSLQMIELRGLLDYKNSSGLMHSLENVYFWGLYSQILVHFRETGLSNCYVLLLQHLKAGFIESNHRDPHVSAKVLLFLRRQLHEEKLADELEATLPDQE